MELFKLEQIDVEVEGRTSVHGVSFEVRPGEIHILMGPNGSGKTTLLNGILGHPKYTITSGRILLGGEDVTTLSTDMKARKGIFLSQQYLPEIPGVRVTNFLYRLYKIHHGDDISVKDFNMKLQSEAREIGIPQELLERELNVGLSGGEKKLSEVLQLALLRPHFALLDEIDSGVDRDSLLKVYRTITRLARDHQVGFILVTHSTGILDHIEPHAVHIMAEGKMVKSGGGELLQRITESGYNDLVADDRAKNE
jgi:Fe-S cluster assembly ATP-binding protein